jgi:hypothetical protein
MEKKHQIFISSTFTDLKAERQAAVEAVLAAGHIPAGMELFAAGDESQMEVIQRWIDDSDVYMLILGGRYGSLHPSTGLSYTEHEYEYALSTGKPFFALVLTENAIELKKAELGDDANETMNLEKYADFRQKVLSKISKLVEDCKDIKIGVLESIRLLERKYSLHGWVRSDTLPEMPPLLKQLSTLTEENSILKAKMAEAPVTSLADGQIKLADLQDKVTVGMEFKSGYDHPARGHKENLSWAEIFSLISPKLLAGQDDDNMKNYIARQILEYKGFHPYSCKVIEQDFQAIKIHLMAINLIDVQYTSTIEGGAALFWNLTPLGKQTLLELRAARKIAGIGT